MTLSFMMDLKDGRYLWAGHIQSLIQALGGAYVKTGCTPSIGTGLQINIAAGEIYYKNRSYSVAATSLTLSSNSSGNPRADLIVWDSSDQTVKVLEGTDTWTDGTNTYPIAPVPADGQVPLAVVVVRDGATDILTDDLYDLRVTGDYPTNRLIVLAVDDTEARSQGTSEYEIKTFRFAKVQDVFDINMLYVVVSLWTDASGFARLRVYIDGTQMLELSTGNTTETVLNGSIDISSLGYGLHDVSIRILNDGDYYTYNQYLLVAGDV